MDNYFHPDVLSRVTGGLVSLPSSIDIDFVRMADELSTHLTKARANAKATGFVFKPVDHYGQAITRTNSSACKQIICCYLIKNMTADEVRVRATYNDNGVDKHEIREWVEAIRTHL